MSVMHAHQAMPLLKLTARLGASLRFIAQCQAAESLAQYAFRTVIYEVFLAFTAQEEYLFRRRKELENQHSSSPTEGPP